MNKAILALSLLLLLPLVFTLGAVSRPATTGPQFAHMVFFELKDHSAEAREKFVASCHKYLSGHDGVQHYSVGTITEEVVEPSVCVRDFDVALHLVFDSKESEAKYLKAPRHVQFVEENREAFAKVRVFDSSINPSPSK